jgi:hypothetical protein
MNRFPHFLLLLLTAIIYSCTPSAPEKTEDEFLKLSGNPSRDNFIESTTESKDYTIRRFSNISISELLDLNAQKGETILQYTAVTKTGEQPVYTKTIVETKDKSARLAVVDLSSGKATWEKEFPIVDMKTDSLTRQTYNSLQACIDDFMCKHQCELESLANKTCETQFAALTCCLANNQCFSVHLVFPPTSIRCLIRPPFDLPSHLKGLVLAN